MEALLVTENQLVHREWLRERTIWKCSWSWTSRARRWPGGPTRQPGCARRSRTSSWLTCGSNAVMRRAEVWLTRIALGVRHHYMLGATAMRASASSCRWHGLLRRTGHRRYQTAVAHAVGGARVRAGAPRTTVPTRPFEFDCFPRGHAGDISGAPTAENGPKPLLVGGAGVRVLLVLTAEVERYAARPRRGDSRDLPRRQRGRHRPALALGREVATSTSGGDSPG